MNVQAYRKPFILALSLHLLIAVLLMSESRNTRPTLIEATKDANASVEVVKAVSVDKQELTQAVNQLKAAQTRKAEAEASKQQALRKEAQNLKKARVLEEQRLQKLKRETAEIAIARKKEAEKEEQRLAELEEKKDREIKQLDQLKRQQQALKAKEQADAQKLAEIKQKRQAELALLAERQAKALADKDATNRAAAAQAAQNAETARVAGEVDKYKALIVNAISRRWILPENVDKSLSSQFRIRLAPDGALIEVSLTRSSGDPLLDRSAQMAIEKAAPLPVPTDPATFNVFRDISLTVRPETVRG